MTRGISAAEIGIGVTAHAVAERGLAHDVGYIAAAKHIKGRQAQLGHEAQRVCCSWQRGTRWVHPASLPPLPTDALLRMHGLHQFSKRHASLLLITLGYSLTVSTPC